MHCSSCWVRFTKRTWYVKINRRRHTHCFCCCVTFVYLCVAIHQRREAFVIQQYSTCSVGVPGTRLQAASARRAISNQSVHAKSKPIISHQVRPVRHVLYTALRPSTTVPARSTSHLVSWLSHRRTAVKGYVLLEYDNNTCNVCRPPQPWPASSFATLVHRALATRFSRFVVLS